ncbi:MAG: DUF2207 domain-containing protein [Alphaproteobacteria bacterium]|nr:DUF2207 domain-containing protein [Alphaproteobacteria bacterium]
MQKIGLFVVSLWLGICVAVCAARAENFYIENYEVVMNVSKNRVVHVKEAITVNFTAPSHGIIRAIPKKQSSVENIRVSENFSKQYYNGNLELKIGDADRMISGKKVYHIEFDHRLYDNKNEFYYNIIGTDWGVPIQKVRFYVKMPAVVDDSKVGLSIGRYGIRGFDGGAEFTVQGAEIFGQTHRSLRSNEGITLRAEVPQGYFRNTQSKSENLVWLGLLFCTLFSFLTWHQYGKDEPVTPVVTFQPPKNITPIDAELVMTEEISNRGLVALIVKLANDGYFKIKSEKQKFTLSDFQEYTGNNDVEHKLLEIFGDQIRSGVVTSSRLKNSNKFYRDWTHLRSDAVTQDDKERYYELSSLSKWRKFVMFLYIVGNILLTGFALGNYGISEAVAGFFVMVIFGSVWFVAAFKSAQISMLLWGLFAFLPMAGSVFSAISIENTSQVIMGVGCAVISMICFAQMMKPNMRGRQLKGQLLGLKKFIEVAEKKRLEMMVEQNPQYFYKILPYAYILGVSDVWIKQFEGIAVPPPDWGDDFIISDFHSLTRGFNASVVPSVANGGVSRTSHSSSGGGGFSGGGHGGGGGRSW